MENTFNGKPIEYGWPFLVLPELTLVCQYNFPDSYNFYMDEEKRLLDGYHSRIAVWRIKSLKN
jgi:hypothetical protein